MNEKTIENLSKPTSRRETLKILTGVGAMIVLAACPGPDPEPKPKPPDPEPPEVKNKDYLNRPNCVRKENNHAYQKMLKLPNADALVKIFDKANEFIQIFEENYNEPGYGAYDCVMSLGELAIRKGGTIDGNLGVQYLDYALLSSAIDLANKDRTWINEPQFRINPLFRIDPYKDDHILTWGQANLACLKMTRQELEQRQALANEEMKRYFDLVKEKNPSTKYETLKLLFEMLIERVEYDTSNNALLGGTQEAFVEKKVRCDGYSGALEFLGAKCGIEIYKIVENSMNHGWNLARGDDGKLYWIDATWDDCGEKSCDRYFFKGSDNFYAHTQYYEGMITGTEVPLRYFIDPKDISGEDYKRNETLHLVCARKEKSAAKRRYAFSGKYA